MLCPYSLRLNREIEVPAVAVHEHEGGIFGRELVRHVLKVAEGRDRLAVDFRDDVADLHAGLAGRTAVGHARHHNAPLPVLGKVEPAGQLRGQLAHVQAGERARGSRLLIAVPRAFRLGHGLRLLADRHVELLVCPFRISLTCTFLPMGVWATRLRNCVGVSTARPSNSMSTSPRSSLARLAGLSDRTSLIRTPLVSDTPNCLARSWVSSWIDTPRYPRTTLPPLRNCSITERTMLLGTAKPIPM